MVVFSSLANTSRMPALSPPFFRISTTSKASAWMMPSLVPMASCTLVDESAYWPRAWSASRLSMVCCREACSGKEKKYALMRVVPGDIGADGSA